MIATSSPEIRIAAKRGLRMPYIWVSLPEKNELTKFASEAIVRIMPISKTDKLKLPYAKSGMPVVYTPERRNAKPKVAMAAVLM
jgi:hypothetical protein